MYAILGGRFPGSNHFLATGASRDDTPQNSGKIGNHGIDGQAAGGDERRDLFLLTLAKFAGEYSARLDQARQFGGDRPIGVKPIDAAVQGASRIEVANLKWQTFDVGGGNVGRV